MLRRGGVAEWSSVLVCQEFRSGGRRFECQPAKIVIVISCVPWQRVIKSRQPQSVPTMPTSLWWNLLSDQRPLMQWGNAITRGILQQTSLARKGLLKNPFAFGITVYF